MNFYDIEEINNLVEEIRQAKLVKEDIENGYGLEGDFKLSSKRHHRNILASVDFSKLMGPLHGFKGDIKDELISLMDIVIEHKNLYLYAILEKYEMEAKKKDIKI